jgi:hypothetical protein
MTIWCDAFDMRRWGAAAEETEFAHWLRPIPVKLWEANEYPQLAANEHFRLTVARKYGHDVPPYRLADDPASDTGPPKSRVIRASKASKRGSPCKCRSRGSRAK